MVSRKQKKVWRYVEAGSLLKLKAYLRKHSDVELNFTQGKRRRGPLHLVCSLGEDCLLSLLIKHGADPLLKDRNGDTALHLAVNRALKHGRTDYNDLVVPLCKRCPDALNAPNNAGVTPRDLLRGLRFNQSGRSAMDSPQRLDPEQQWRERLLGECEDEFFETFGQYDDDFLRDNEDEADFADWADRIRREYDSKQRARAMRERGSGGRKKSKGDDEEEERKHKELHTRLEKEHREYQERAARKRAETQQGKKRRYEERCHQLFLNPSSSSSSSNDMLAYDDIPWPAPRGSVDEMMTVILHGVDRSDASGFRKFLRRQQTLWHPDKFAQRCGGRLRDTDSQRIMDTVTALSQELNRAAQSLR